jgi:opacity protein-like surface antigen
MIRRLFLAAALALCSLAASAQSLTQAQLQTLKTFINTVPAWAALPNNSDTAFFIAGELNKAAVPAFVVWRTNVTADEIGNAWVGTDIDGMAALNMQRLQLLLASSPSGVFDMSRVDRRAGFENPFGTNQNNASRVAMRAVWKRAATVAEKLYATGTGSDASPGTMTFTGVVSYPEVFEARSL